MGYDLQINNIKVEKKWTGKMQGAYYVGNSRYGNSRYIMSSQTAWHKLMGLNIFYRIQLL